MGTEVISLRGERSKVYSLGNGRFELVCGNGVRHYWTGNIWDDVDLSISEAPFTLGFTHYFSKNKIRTQIDNVNGIIRIYPILGDDTKYIEFRGSPVNPVDFEVSSTATEILCRKDTAAMDYRFYITPNGIRLSFLAKNATKTSVTLGFRCVGLDRVGREIYNGDNKLGTLPNPTVIGANGIEGTVNESISGDTAVMTIDYTGLTFPAEIT